MDIKIRVDRTEKRNLIQTILKEYGRKFFRTLVVIGIQQGIQIIRFTYIYYLFL